MGLAAGINFSLRSVALAAESYRRDEAEQLLKPDEILQMFGRAGRRGLDETGFVLVTANELRLLDARPDLVGRTDRIDATRLAEELASAHPPAVIDVRGPRERDEKRIEGSLHVPLNHLDEHLAEIPRDRRLVVHCATGYRSSIAASLLRCRDFADVADLAGGIAAWETINLPMADAGR